MIPELVIVFNSNYLFSFHLLVLRQKNCYILNKQLQDWVWKHWSSACLIFVHSFLFNVILRHKIGK